MIFVTLDLGASLVSAKFDHLEGIKSLDLCCRLLKQNIFIKDLTKKVGDGKEYVRIAVRNEMDNALLVKVLKEIDRVLGI